MFKPYVFSLVFALMSRNKGNFLFSADYLIQQSCGSTLRFPCSVSVNVHCRTDISVSEKFLHIFRRCTVWQQIACISMSEHMEMKTFQSLRLFSCCPAHNPHRTRRFKCPVRSEADKGLFLRDLAEWEYQVSRKPTAAAKEQHRPPEKQSVLKHLREIQERNKQKPPQRQRKKSIDRDSR